MLLLWDYHNQVQQPSYPLSFDPEFPELALRGMCTMLPGLEPYLARLPRPHMDGGYYTKTPENRPLIGPLGAEGAWVLGALSGFGLMAAPAAAELLALQLTGAEPPHYAGAFWLERYADPAYQAQLENWGPGSQL
jgi:glycine/D-amino acid oxidase-like deaminating enzyme